MSQAGGTAQYGYAGMFWKATNPIGYRQRRTSQYRTAMAEPFGDMRQELVFIGQGLNQTAMTEALDNCLLNRLIALGLIWVTLTIPFPPGLNLTMKMTRKPLIQARATESYR